MRYQLGGKAGSLCPRAATVLAALGDRPLYHAKYANRHPLGAYNVTFGEVMRYMTQVLDELDRVAPEAMLAIPASSWGRGLLSATDHLLDAIVQHLDSFGTIVEAFFESKDSDEAERIKRSVRGEIRSYRDHAAKIVNAIKHRQAKLAPFCFHDVGLFVPGYFVEGVCADGAIGPDPTIHADSNSAISFNRDLPFHMVNLYFASAVLGGAIQSLARSKPENAEERPSDADRQLAEVMRRLSLMPRVFFPDEAKKPVPLVECRGATASPDFSVVLEYPAMRAKPHLLPRGCRAHVTWTGDGASRSFKVPYWTGSSG